MRKLELRIDDLAVETFETSPATGAPGTVRGHVFENFGDPFAAAPEPGVPTTPEPVTGKQTCAGWNTCGGAQTCNFQNTCYTFNGGWTCDPDASCNPTPNCPQGMY